MEGMSTTPEVVALSPNKKERLNDALLRYIQKKGIHSPGNKILLTERDLGLLHIALYKDENSAMHMGQKIEQIKPEEIRSYILSHPDCEIIPGIIRKGPHHTERVILRPGNKEHRDERDDNKFFGVPVPKHPPTKPPTEVD